MGLKLLVGLKLLHLRVQLGYLRAPRRTSKASKLYLKSKQIEYLRVVGLAPSRKMPPLPPHAAAACGGKKEGGKAGEKNQKKKFSAA